MFADRRQSLSRRRVPVCLMGFLGLAGAILSARIGFGAEAIRPTGEGLRGVVATRDTIRMLSFPAQGAVRVAEFLPGQTPSLSNATAVVSRLVVQTGFVARIPRFDGPRDRLYSSFMTFQELPRGGLVPLGTNHFVEEMYGLARDREPFPEPASKKGLQVQMVDDALALGIKHAALNVDLAAMVDLTRRPDSLPFEVDGHLLHFNRQTIESLDARVQPLSQAGVVVALTLLNYRSDDPARARVLLHPRHDTNSPNGLSAFNTVTPEGIRWFRGCVEFLAARYTDPERRHGRVLNFIIGNEINSHWFWYNLGRAPMETVADDYLRTLRLACTAVRRHSTGARVYVSLEHHWNIRCPGGDDQQAFAGRPFLEYLNRLSKRHGDIDWGVAFHPYPESLFDCRTWLDQSATTNADTARITFKNLEMLPRFLRQRPMLFRGRPRRVILSEQRFHTGEGADAERLQAAAFAYAYCKVARLDGIDAFIVQRQVDHGGEGGLLGLWSRDPQASSASKPARNKLLYDVFQKADSPDWERAFEFALPIIGIKSWEELLPQ
jgi:hypothetical protein